jgi:hypothetical protein
MKKFNNDFSNLNIILIINLLIRLFLPLKNSFSEYYRFNGSWLPYFYLPDTYYYLKKWNENGFSNEFAFFFQIIMVALTIIIFYFTIKKFTQDNKLLITSSLLFSLFPFIMMNTFFTHIDTPYFILLCLVSNNYLIINILETKNDIIEYTEKIFIEKETTIKNMEDKKDLLNDIQTIFFHYIKNEQNLDLY